MNQTVVGDIGGTNMRLLTFDPQTSDLQDPKLLSQSEIMQHPAAIGDGNDYVADCIQSRCSQPSSVVLAVAGAVRAGCVQMTNAGWQLSQARLAKALGCPVILVNDFAAQGAAIDALTGEFLVTLQAGNGKGGGNRIVTGPGTGLGLCARPAGSAAISETEGGHAQFAPVTEEEWHIGQILAARFGRVSWERLLSGPGLLNLYQALARLHGQPGHCEAPAQVTNAAKEGDALALKTVECFAQLLGSYAGDMALAHGATGGVYITGGLVAHLQTWLSQQALVDRFANKGRFREYLQAIPLHLMVAPQPGLIGAGQIALTRS